jgi:RND family efflux transporter MFP subunit
MKETTEPPSYTIFEVENVTVGDRYEASGSLHGEQTAILTSKITGYVKELRVEAGDRVPASRVLAVLDAPELGARLRAAESGLGEVEQAVVEAEAALTAARAQARVAEATFDRFVSLREKRAVTRQEFDEVEARHAAARAGLSMAEAALARARSARSRAEAEVSGARSLYDYRLVKAPFDGRVLERQVDIGNLAAPGAPLFVLEKDGPLRAEVSVEESMAGRIRKGDLAEIVIPHRETPLSGSVTEVVPRIDVQTRAFQVKVELPRNSPQDLVPGSFVRVRFHVGETTKLLVPRTSLVSRGQLSMVYIVEGERASLRLVTLGHTRGDEVEVLSGLNEGDRIVREASALESRELAEATS